jgi:hypothetical protein
MPSFADILLGLEKRIIVLERLAGVEPDPSTLVHPKSEKHAEFRAAKVAGKKTGLAAEEGAK